MFKFNNSIVPNKERIGLHFSSNKHAYSDAYSALKSKSVWDHFAINNSYTIRYF